MNKIMVGLIFGVVLGAVDGATALFYPETRPLIAGNYGGIVVQRHAGWPSQRLVCPKSAIDRMGDRGGIGAGPAFRVHHRRNGREQGKTALS
jgi:hypothetical protein